MKKQLLLLVMILLPMVASADPVEIDGIYYYLIPKGNIAEVKSKPNKYTGNVVIPESVTYENVNYSVTSISDSAFHRCSGLSSITIPNSVTRIGNFAFYGCSSLTSVTIPNSVTIIGEVAFSQCNNLTSVHIFDLEAWCKIVFSNEYANPLCCAQHLYMNGEEIKDMIIPGNVTTIGNYAFYGCLGLISVTISNNVTSIGERVFEGCSKLTSVIIPNSVTSIGKYAFQDCLGLTSVTIPNSVTNISDYTFTGCSGLTSVTIPNSVTSIGGSAFANCISLTSVTIPNSVTNIGRYAFYQCSGLTAVAIPNSVSIGVESFARCIGMTSVTIGSAIRKIEDQAFASCSNLTDVYCYAINVPNTKNSSFIDSYIDYATLHVPAESVDAYKVAEPWKNFKEIVAIDDEAAIRQEIMNNKQNATYYSLDGQQISLPKNGINIVKMNNGKTMKVLLK